MRFLVVAWMIPCVVYPMGLIFLYYEEMLRPEMRMVVFPQRATYDGTTLSVTFLPTDEEDDRPIPTPISAKVKEIERTKGSLVFTLEKGTTPLPPFIVVPAALI